MTKQLRTIAATGFAFGLCLALAQTVTAQQYLVLGEGAEISEATVASIAAAGGKVNSRLDQIGLALVESDNPSFLRDIYRATGVRIAAVDPDVQWIDPTIGEVVSAEDFGNPPDSGDDDFFFDLQWGHDAVNSPEAWSTGYRGAGARVAILDSGVDADHPDIAPNLNVDLSTSFVPGEDFDIAPGFYFNHGTHVAGIVGAADNAFGTIGIAPEAELVVVKVLSEFTGSGTFSGVIEGIVYATDVGADIINMSLGATFAQAGSGGAVAADLKVLIEEATQYAFDNGTTIFASAGNSGLNLDAGIIHLPSDAKHVISIAASAPEGWAVDSSTNLDVPSSFTNYGSVSIDFGAPGGDFDLPGDDLCTVAGITVPCWVFDMSLSTISEGWGWAAGTSMASPHAAGVAALVVGKYGEVSPTQLRSILRGSADKLGTTPGNDDFFGWGRVNAYAAVRSGSGALAEAESSPATVLLAQNYPNPFADNTSVAFRLDEQHHVNVKVYDILGREIVKLVDATLPAGMHSLDFDASQLPGGTYIYRIEAARTDGGGSIVQTRRMTLAR